MTYYYHTDLHCLLRLDSSAKEHLPENEVYKGCSFVANNGLFRSEESELPAPARKLLNLRRKIRLLPRAYAVQSELEEFESGESLPLFRGDAQFLLALVYFRQGAVQKAAKKMLESADEFSRGGEMHRELRARINQMILVAPLTSYTGGEIAGLEKEVTRGNAHDLRGLIQRSRAIELLRAGRLAHALSEASSARHSYELDGCPQDQSIAVCLGAIMELLSCNNAKAFELRQQVMNEDGRVTAYISVYDSLLAGREPRLPKGHPLDQIPWSTLWLKPESVAGKIIANLRQGPASRDELIEQIWGSNATDPSYINRLHAQVTNLRKRNRIPIWFDGERYHMTS